MSGIRTLDIFTTPWTFLVAPLLLGSFFNFIVNSRLPGATACFQRFVLLSLPASHLTSFQLISQIDFLHCSWVSFPSTGSYWTQGRWMDQLDLGPDILPVLDLPGHHVWRLLCFFRHILHQSFHFDFREMQCLHSIGA